MADSKVSALTALTAVTGDDLLYVVEDPSGTPAPRKATAAILAAYINGTLNKAITPGGRLTLESGVPVSTTDQTAKTSIYYTPYVHNIINLWDGTEWKPISFTEYTLALGTLTSGKPYDVFAYLNSGALALEVLVWTNDTTRATAVTLQDGRYCKDGDKTRLLLGSFYTTATTTTEDSVANRYLSNVHNKTVRALSHTTNDAGHTYATNTIRSYNASDTHRVNVMAPLSTPVFAAVAANISAAAGVTGDIFVGVDSTAAGSSFFTAASVQGAVLVRGAAAGEEIVAPGKHYVQILERASAATVTYSYGLLRGSLQC